MEPIRTFHFHYLTDYFNPNITPTLVEADMSMSLWDGLRMLQHSLYMRIFPK